ncbi:response regulator transcription factor [Paenibacillus sp. NFR01]|uniref:response regulator transcription factor n=1 Tax=Paenibacillus sp. NFR01 TaxID=1566279 RepID=UPI0008AD5300|nr:response regulator transcription factor [Paenibacillus sp. NFR01]SET24723.1 DNA-binding response regulator, OmpR family, contains REC and winged-helix (wHTH) domain [Paenibacillus sp. NFR01]
MAKKVLIVEDEQRIRELISDYFHAQDWMVCQAANGNEGMFAFETEIPDLIILDLMMPEMDGWELCRKIRQRSGVPIIILTAVSGDERQIEGYELGADDYVTKPFSPKVLVSKAEVLMRRVNGHMTPDAHILIGLGIQLNTRSYKLESKEEAIDLTPKEYDILQLLLRNRGIVMPRETILNYIWGAEYDGDGRVVDTHIKKLRNKMGPASDCIRTIFGIGYTYEEKR